MLAHPPPPSVVKHLAERSADDLPSTSAAPSTSTSSSSRRRGTSSKRKLTTPREIIFRDDAIRDRFIRDHPFEAFRPVNAQEGDVLADEPEPKGVDWTMLAQRGPKPSVEDAVAFTLNLHDAHGLPLSLAYTTTLAQFRTLRAEQEVATRAAHIEAVRFGATFFGEIERGARVEEAVLDAWQEGAASAASEIEKVTGQPSPLAAPSSSSSSANEAQDARESVWNDRRMSAVRQADSRAQLESESGLSASLAAGAQNTPSPSYTGGKAYVERVERELLDRIRDPLTAAP